MLKINGSSKFLALYASWAGIQGTWTPGTGTEKLNIVRLVQFIKSNFIAIIMYAFVQMYLKVGRFDLSS